MTNSVLAASPTFTMPVPDSETADAMERLVVAMRGARCAGDLVALGNSAVFREAQEKFWRPILVEGEEPLTTGSIHPSQLASQGAFRGAVTSATGGEIRVHAATRRIYLPGKPGYDSIPAGQLQTYLTVAAARVQGNRLAPQQASGLLRAAVLIICCCVFLWATTVAPVPALGIAFCACAAICAWFGVATMLSRRHALAQSDLQAWWSTLNDYDRALYNRRANLLTWVPYSPDGLLQARLNEVRAWAKRVRTVGWGLSYWVPALDRISYQWTLDIFNRFDKPLFSAPPELVNVAEMAYHWLSADLDWTEVAQTRSDVWNGEIFGNRPSTRRGELRGDRCSSVVYMSFMPKYDAISPENLVTLPNFQVAERLGYRRPFSIRGLLGWRPSYEAWLETLSDVDRQSVTRSDEYVWVGRGSPLALYLAAVSAERQRCEEEARRMEKEDAARRERERSSSSSSSGSSSSSSSSSSSESDSDYFKRLRNSGVPSGYHV